MSLKTVITSFAENNITRLATVYKWKIPTDFPTGNISVSSNAAESSKALKLALHQSWINADDDTKEELEKWYVIRFGGVKGNKPATLTSYAKAAEQDLIGLGEKGIASWSKMLCVRNPYEFPIFDARVSISLNSLLYADNSIKDGMFPLLASQNGTIKNANKFLKAICPKPVLRNNFYDEYRNALSSIAKGFSASNNKISVMDLEMLLFAMAEDLARKKLV